jgi:nitroreductase/NAD-dependent dihydropyrimidine dehydrogenase PreA subunit
VYKLVEVNKIVNPKIEVDLDICTKCKACTRACPLRLYYFRDDNLVMRRSTEILCMECGHCFAVCPVNAIKLRNYPDGEKVENLEDFELPPYKTILSLIKARRSIRNFKSEPIPEDLWKKLIDAGKYSPTGHNDQLLNFTILRDPELLKKFSDAITKGFIELSKIYAERSKWREYRKSFEKNNLKIIEGVLPYFNDTFKGIERGEDFWRWYGKLMIIHAPKKTVTLIQDCSVAANNIMLVAESLRLGTCSLGIATVAINEFKNVANVIQFPNNHVAAYTLAIGFPKVKYYRIPPRRSVNVKWL